MHESSLNKKKKIFLVLIIIMACLLRLYGIGWGLPNKEHFFSFIPDEFTWIRWVSNLHPEKLDFDPSAPMGVFLIYTYAVFLKISSFLKFVTLTADYSFYYRNPHLFTRIYIVGRLLCCLCGILTVYATFLLGKKLYSIQIGLLAAFLLSISTLHVIHSHFLHANIPATFCMTLAIIFALDIFRKGGLSSYILTGIIIGLAISVKQYAVLLIPMIHMADYLRQYNTFHLKRIPHSIFNKQILIAYLSIFAAFLLTNPYFFANFKEIYWKENISTLNIYLVTKNLSSFSVSEQVSNSILASLKNLAHSFKNVIIAWNGFPFFLTFCAGLALSFIKHTKEDILLLMFFIPYLLIVLYSNVMAGNYYIPLLPVGALFVAKFFYLLKYHHLKIVRIIGIIFAIAVSVHIFIYTLAFEKYFREKDVREIASDWILNNIPKNSEIAVIHEPYWDSPSVVYNQYFYNGKSKVFRLKDKLYSINKIDNELRFFGEIKRGNFIIFSNWYWRYLLHKEPDYHLTMSTLNNYNFKLVYYINKEPEVFGFKFKRPDALALDLSQISPRIYIFRKF